MRGLIGEYNSSAIISVEFYKILPDLDTFSYVTLWKESLNIDGQQFHKYQ